MADVSITSTGAGGLGTRYARWVFVFLWFCGVCSGLLQGFLTPLDPLNATAYAAALVGALLLTRPGAQPLPPRLSVWVPPISLYITVIALYRTPEITTLSAMTFAAYLVAFLIPRGNAVAGVIGTGLIVAYAAVWMLPAAPPGEGVALVIGIPIGCLVAGIVWRIVLAMIVRRQRAHRTAAALSAERAAAADAATAAVEQSLRDVAAVAVPLLARVAAGEVVDAELRARLTLVEASIRDELRAPRLQHPALATVVERLRTRGVTVVLFGESSGEHDVVGDALGRRIAETIAPVAAGRITVRTLPAGRAAAVSIVLPGDGGASQVLLDGDGMLISRN
ncbi:MULTISPECIES: hypothetical protein [unclassified Microbacterium]|uniref:hypothetical protein n=1 Tax=unclassified Microbacterium TaxID=2609290 RepID=UPI003016973C